jgi:hypothetical protein
MAYFVADPCPAIVAIWIVLAPREIDCGATDERARANAHCGGSRRSIYVNPDCAKIRAKRALKLVAQS